MLNLQRLLKILSNVKCLKQTAPFCFHDILGSQMYLLCLYGLLSFSLPSQLYRIMMCNIHRKDLITHNVNYSMIDNNSCAMPFLGGFLHTEAG